jgi:hypothetical protein
MIVPRSIPVERCLVAGAALFVLACAPPPVYATPPSIVEECFDPDALQRATVGFGDEARRWFARLVAALPTKADDGAKGRDRRVCTVNPHGIGRALVTLLCPAWQRGEFGRIDAFFEELERKQLVDGHVSHVGRTIVSYRLIQDGGQWQLVTRHRPASGQATGQDKSPSFVEVLACRATGHSLRGANLRKADLRSENLRGADLYAANLAGADLTGADLQGSDLRSTDLSGAVGLTQDQLDSAIIDQRTLLPAYLKCK